MQVRFTLESSGAKLSALFESFRRKNERLRSSGAGRVSFGGPCHSDANYIVRNPTDSGPAVVDYDGSCKLFRQQGLIPDKLFARQVGKATVFTGTGLKKHRLGAVSHPDVRVLVEAYELMTSSPTGLSTCIHAAETAKAVNNFIARKGGFGGARAWTCSNDWSEAARPVREPALRLSCRVAGEWVEIRGGFSPCEDVARQAKKIRSRFTSWLSRLRPVLKPVRQVKTAGRGKGRKPDRSENAG
jgi:hypothetical protein